MKKEKNTDDRSIDSLPFKEEVPERLSLGHYRANALAQFYRSEAKRIVLVQSIVLAKILIQKMWAGCTGLDDAIFPCGLSQ